MAKADYLIQDQWGLRWFVRQGDPVHRYVQLLPKEVKAAGPVFLRKHIMGQGFGIPRSDLDVARQRLERLGRYAAGDPDDGVAQATIRTLQLVRTLEALLEPTGAGGAIATAAD